MITRFLRKQKARLRARWLRGSIDKALRLSRYEVRGDRLMLEGRSFRLAVTWRARHIHPWDYDLPPDTKELKLVDQTFADTFAALDRLFTALPEVDVIDIRVMEPDSRSHGTLLKGIVSREDFKTYQMPSPTMRLRLLGINYNLVNSRLEPIAPSCAEREIPFSEIAARHLDGSFESDPSSEPEKEPHPGWHRGKAGPH
ncbi:MAG: hypothetical protein ABSD30_11730 [Candidatus Binatus sp.]|jgi:hypothetical protein